MRASVGVMNESVLQHVADRLDPTEIIFVSVDEGDYLGSRGSSSRAENADTAFKISSVRFNSRFSRNVAGWPDERPAASRLSRSLDARPTRRTERSRSSSGYFLGAGTTRSSQTVESQGNMSTTVTWSTPSR